jgi:uncharacterized protein YceK
MRTILVSIAVVLFLAGCQTSPVVSGHATDQGLSTGGRHHKTWELNEKQQKKMTVWLQEHDSGWGYLLVTPPLPTFTIFLKYADGSGTFIELFSANERWKRALVRKNRVRTISAEEREYLLDLVKEIPND